MYTRWWKCKARDEEYAFMCKRLAKYVNTGAGEYVTVLGADQCENYNKIRETEDLIFWKFSGVDECFCSEREERMWSIHVKRDGV